jgi:hypothetical protein
MKKKTYDRIREEFSKIIKKHDLYSEAVVVTAVPLSAEEAIGNPEDRDYPLVIGKERMMQAEFRGALGQAFTDMYGNFSGQLSDIVAMNLENNFRRAIFISSLNAVLRSLGLITQTQHCRDEEPRLCSQELVKHIKGEYGDVRIALVGFQPRLLEALSQQFELRATDLDKTNIGTEKSGVIIDGPDRTAENLGWCDLALVTGTTVVNNTIDQFTTSKPVIFYGVTISGAAKLLGLNQFCYCGH